MELSAALDYARAIKRGVLSTAKANGRPQMSNILFWIDDGGTIRISVTASRAKTANMLRDPRVSLHVTAPDFWSYVVLEADAELAPVAAEPDDATVDELVELYRALQGEHPDWADYRAAMVAEGRLVARLKPTRCYGALPPAA